MELIEILLRLFATLLLLGLQLLVQFFLYLVLVEGLLLLLALNQGLQHLGMLQNLLDFLGSELLKLIKDTWVNIHLLESLNYLIMA